MKPVSELVKDSLKQIERVYLDRDQGSITGIASGFTDLDRITGGFHRGELTVIGGRPMTGKTSLALNIAAHAACDDEIGVAYISPGLSQGQVIMRLLCAEARVDYARVRMGFLGERDFPKLAQAAARLDAGRMFIDDNPDRLVRDLPAEIRKHSPIGLIIVDHLQRLLAWKSNDVAIPTWELREAEVAQIARTLKNMAKEMKVPVIATSELSRDVEKRRGRHPILSDLRESSAIEEEADVVMLLHRDELYTGHKSEFPGTAEIMVAKQLNGPTDMARLTFINHYCRFENYMPDTGVFEDSPEVR